MKLTPKIREAIDLASRLHNGQLRKAEGNLPYISHPFAVAWILSSYTDDEDTIIAGLLHDVLEDVEGYYYQDLVRDAGANVAEIVKGVSEDRDYGEEEIDPKSTWEERKIKYLAALEYDRRESLMVCAADKIHNLESMMALYRQAGESMWQHFNSPKGKKLWLYQEISKFLRTKLDNPIIDELDRVYAEAEKLML
jgi:(p)ppGpp synthase/HD superfamily hydrolase